MNKYVPEYMAAVHRRNGDEAIELIKMIVANRCQKIAAFICLDPFTSELTAAALTLVANSVYSTLSDGDKALCDKIVKGTSVTTIVAPLNKKTEEMRKRTLGEESE